jgi:hypothetical protein
MCVQNWASHNWVVLSWCPDCSILVLCSGGSGLFPGTSSTRDFRNLLRDPSHWDRVPDAFSLGVPAGSTATVTVSYSTSPLASKLASSRRVAKVTVRTCNSKVILQLTVRYGVQSRKHRLLHSQFIHSHRGIQDPTTFLQYGTLER